MASYVRMKGKCEDAEKRGGSHQVYNVESRGIAINQTAKYLSDYDCFADSE